MDTVVCSLFDIAEGAVGVRVVIAIAISLLIVGNTAFLVLGTLREPACQEESKPKSIVCPGEAFDRCDFGFERYVWEWRWATLNTRDGQWYLSGTSGERQFAFIVESSAECGGRFFDRKSGDFDTERDSSNQDALIIQDATADCYEAWNCDWFHDGSLIDGWKEVIWLVPDWTFQEYCDFGSKVTGNPPPQALTWRVAEWNECFDEGE